MRSVLFSTVLALTLAIGACEGGPAGSDDPPPPSWDPGKFDLPTAQVDGLRGFYLIGNALTAGHDRLDLTVRVAVEAGVQAWVDGEYVGRLEPDEPADTFRLTADIAALGPGEHQLLLAEAGSEDAFASLAFVRTHPLYVAVTTDWDDPDNDDATFTRQEELHEWHPGLRITSFVGPYTFTDPTVSPERAQWIVNWLTSLRDQYGDEIGLHIHPYCSFIGDAGLSCRTSPSFAYSTGDATGYTVYLGAYDEAETNTMLDRALQIFEEHGLGRPTSFRSGGWTAEIQTFRALAGHGFVAETSAMDCARLEEWRGYPGATIYQWNCEHWNTITETSQPYYPNENDVLSSEAPQLPMLEVPDNGLLVDYVTAEEMIEMFGANWPGGALDAPRSFVIGYHPPNFSAAFQQRIHGALTHIDRFLASSGTGPVVYARLSDFPLVWPRGETETGPDADGDAGADAGAPDADAM
jgi:hypothetical protein